MTDTQSAPRDSYRQQWRYVAALWRDREIFGIEKLVLMAVAAGRFLLPSLHINKAAGMRSYPSNKRLIEVWVACKPLLLLFLLAMGYGARGWTAFLAIILLADVYLYLIGAVLLSRPNYFAKPVSPGRSLILAFINYLEITLCFAVLYLWLGGVSLSGSAFPLGARDWQNAFYFSIITSATVGYGDFVPYGSVGRLIAAVQVFLSLVFAAAVLSVLVSRVADLPSGPTQGTNRDAKGGA